MGPSDKLIGSLRERREGRQSMSSQRFNERTLSRTWTSLRRHRETDRPLRPAPFVVGARAAPLDASALFDRDRIADVTILTDVLREGLRVVFCGTAVGPTSARVGAYYARPGNQFWSVLYEIG